MFLSIATILAIVQTDTSSAPHSDADIIVRARRAEAQLSACLARDCPTPEDVRLSIAHAEAQFVEGRYREARITLKRAVARNRKHAARFPRHVAALYETQSTVAVHFGDLDDHKRSTGQQARILRQHLPEDDPKVLLTAIQLGDSWLKRGHIFYAERQYREAERGLEARGEHRLAAFAALRTTAIRIMRKDTHGAAEALARVNAGPAAKDPVIAAQSAILATRLGLAKGDETAVDRLVATLRTDPATPPVLLEQPTVHEGQQPAVGTQSDPVAPLLAPQTGPSSSPIRWADIGFLVAPDGSVQDAEVLRGNRMQGWTERYVAQVAGRRYAPLALPADHPGMYRVERFTLRALRRKPIGSLVKQPVGPVSVEILDLTAIDTPPPPS